MVIPAGSSQVDIGVVPLTSVQRDPAPSVVLSLTEDTTYNIGSSSQGIIKLSASGQSDCRGICPDQPPVFWREAGMAAVGVGCDS